jgi:hypothetical protein
MSRGDETRGLKDKTTGIVQYSTGLSIVPSQLHPVFFKPILGMCFFRFSAFGDILQDEKEKKIPRLPVSGEK